MLPSFSLLLPAFGLLVNKNQKLKSFWHPLKFEYLFSCSRCKGGTEDWARGTWSSRLNKNHSRIEINCKQTRNQFQMIFWFINNLQWIAATKLTTTKWSQITNWSLALCVVMNMPKNIHIDLTEYSFHNWRQQAWSFEIGWPLDLHTGGERWRRRARYLETGGGRHPQPHLQVFWCLPMSCTKYLKLSGLLNLEMEKMKWNCPGKNT